jgi:hypothetical protein
MLRSIRDVGLPREGKVAFMPPSLATRGEYHARAKIDPWRIAYGCAFANVLIFLLLSLINSASNVRDLQYFSTAELIYFAGSLGCFFLLLRSGGELAAVSFYVFASGFLAGFGIFFSTVWVPDIFNNYFSPDDQYRLLAKVDLVNSLSATVVLATAWLFCNKSVPISEKSRSVEELAAFLTPYRQPLLALAIFMLLFQIVTFPGPTNLAVKSIIDRVSMLAQGAIVLYGMQWSKLRARERVLPSLVVIANSGLGFFFLMKQAILLPVVALMAGLVLDRGSRKLLVVLAVSTVVSYFLVIAPFVGAARLDVGNRSGGGLAEGAQVLANTADRLTTVLPVASDEDTGTSAARTALLLTRFGDAPLQAYEIDQYDHGRPYDSLSEPWVAVIPRLLWPGKPDITRFGAEFDAQFWNRDSYGGSLAPTFSSEGYWNYGWPGVVFVSIIYGINVGWFTARWFAFCKWGMKRAGILIFAVPMIFCVISIQGWVVSTFIGGFVSLAVFIGVADEAISWFLGRKKLDTPYRTTEA